MPAWNSHMTEEIPTITTSRVSFAGQNGDTVNAYYAHPTDGSGPYPGIVLIHHAPGWDEFYMELTRRFAHHGFASISHNLYARFGPGSADDVAARARGQGGVADAQVVADAEAAADFLRAQPYANGKVGVIGSCSGGRLSVVIASMSKKFDAAVDLWGGNVVQANLTANQPVAPIDMTKDLNAPLLGIFGNDDMNPSAAAVDMHEAELKKHGKNYEFHRYDGAGHGFWYYHGPAYRPQAAMDSLDKTFKFFDMHLIAV